ncbi:MAG: hypothetical protein GY909_06805 [Oligoflexia bacterium]|nr:hypothetical protein [Oligoflexia bacterium]
MGKTAKNKFDKYDFIYSQLEETTKEDEVRLILSDALGISLFLKLIGSTDGFWNGNLFEFKYDKKFRGSSRWNRSAYATLAQGIFYCRKILNYEIEDVEELPHTIVVLDKSGGFFVKTEDIDAILCLNPDSFSTSIEALKDGLQLLLGNDYKQIVRDCNFSWSTPPSSQDEGLVKMLQQSNLLEKINYYDFSKAGQLQLFLETIKDSEGKIPQIPITKNNFIPIYEKWFSAFAPADASKRDWADKYIMDLRLQYNLNQRTGELVSEHNSFDVPVDRYKSFWKLYRRPPEDSVDKFIATNKDLLFDVYDQNNHGDFYTPLRVADMAQSIIFKYIDDSNKKRVWWDPAAGGGNLFFKFTGPNKVILTTKFDNDVDGLKSNISVNSDHVMQLDFVQDLVEKDMLHIDKWKKIEKMTKGANEIVFFMNPPFDDQAESRGENQSLPVGFFDDCDTTDVTARSLRAMHTRFLYRIQSLARRMNKKVWVAVFSKTGWIVGPDSKSFFKNWSSDFRYKDGFIISSKVFNGVKAEWPCIFSLWEFCERQVDEIESYSPKSLDVFDKNYNYVGKKTIIPFSESFKRMSDIAKLDKKLKKELTFVPAVPLQNEFEVAEKVYEDKLPKDALGYIRIVANDVYNSAKRVQITSSIFGPSNHNGSPIIDSNFVEALAVYGIRKCVRKTWLNDKDEFYIPSSLSAAHEKLIQKAAIFALIDGAYASSMKGLKYKGKSYSFRNQFFICSNLEIRSWGSKDHNFEDSHAFNWIKKNRSKFTKQELNAIDVTKKLIKESFKNNVRSKGDTKRQIKRGDAGIRQLINGLFEFDGAKLPQKLLDTYSEYQKTKEALRESLEKDVYKLMVILPFEESSDFGPAKKTSKKALKGAAERLQKAVPKKKKSTKKKKA